MVQLLLSKYAIERCQHCRIEILHRCHVLLVIIIDCTISGKNYTEKAGAS